MQLSLIPSFINCLCFQPNRCRCRSSVVAPFAARWRAATDNPTCSRYRFRRSSATIWPIDRRTGLTMFLVRASFQTFFEFEFAFFWRKLAHRFAADNARTTRRSQRSARWQQSSFAVWCCRHVLGWRHSIFVSHQRSACRLREMRVTWPSDWALVLLTGFLYGRWRHSIRVYVLLPCQPSSW